MKLLFCQDCKDIIRLFRERRYCKCQKVSGYYTNDTEAVFRGKPILIGIDNKSFAESIKLKNILKTSNFFEVFVIGKDCITFRPENKKDIKDYNNRNF